MSSAGSRPATVSRGRTALLIMTPIFRAGAGGAGPAGKAERVQVGHRLDEVDLVEIEAVGPEALQAPLELAHDAVVGPLFEFRGQKDLLAAGLEDPAQALFADDGFIGVVVG